MASQSMELMHNVLKAAIQLIRCSRDTVDSVFDVGTFSLGKLPYWLLYYTNAI